MSATELIEQIKALPADDLEIVRQFFLNGAASADNSQAVRYATDVEFNAAADRVFEKHEELMRKLSQ